jgi:PAS domain S-box-containing protein
MINSGKNNIKPVKTELKKEELLNRYNELQLRVTKFSAVEQELINTRNRLDTEISMHKRMHAYNKSAFAEMSDSEFVALAAEAVIDIFEVEAGLVIVNHTDMIEIPVVGVEGLSVQTENYPVIFTILNSLFDSDTSGNVIRFESSAFDSLKNYLPYSRAYGVRYHDNENSVSIIILGGVSAGGRLLYDPLDKDREVIFSIFAQKVLAQAVNRKKNQTIRQHSDKIDMLGKRLSRITEGFLSFGTNPKNNISQLAKICAEMMNSDLYSYYYFENNNVRKIGTCGGDYITCSYCSNVYKRYNADSFVRLKYDDIAPLRAGLVCKFSVMKSTLGCAVTLDGKTVGILEIVHAVDYEPTGNDRQMMEIVAAAIAVEERRKIAVTALEDSELRYRMLFDGTPNGILIADARTSEFRYANNSICNMLGYSNEKLLKLQLKDIHSADSIKNVISHFSSMASGITSTAYEIPFLKKDGTEFFADISTYRLTLGNTELIAAFITDITFRKNATEEIIKSNTELKKINSELDNFVYSITHDLRAPLLAMKGLLNLISLEEGNAEAQKKYLKLADESATRLDDNIQEILEFSRNSRLELQYEDIDIRSMVLSVYESIRYYHMDDIDFQLDIDENLNVVSDSFRINTLLKNIITNSVKYRKRSEEISFVKVTCKIQKSKILISVLDNGEGIPEKHLPDIFSMFFRASNTASGTGLGLYICSEIVSKLGGTISVKSEEGKYTEISITLNNNTLIPKEKKK